MPTQDIRLAKKAFSIFFCLFRWSTRKSLPPWLSRNWVFSIELWWSSVPENIHPFQNSDKTYRCYHSLPNVQTQNDTQQKDWTGILLVHDCVSLMQKHFIYIRVLMTFALKLGAPKPHQYTSMDTSSLFANCRLANWLLSDCRSINLTREKYKVQFNSSRGIFAKLFTTVLSVV